MLLNNATGTSARCPHGAITAGMLVLCCSLVIVRATAFAASCNQPFSEVFREASPSVVRVFSIAIDPFSLIDRVQLGVGTGVVIDEDGHIVTNAHVVHGTSEIMVSKGEEDMLPAEIVGLDPISDLAVLKLSMAGIELEAARLGSSADLAIGAEVMAVGYPFGIGKTATRGIVSAMDRVLPLSPFSWMAPFIQIDVAINPGNSGGPLLNRCGEVIGINTLGAQRAQNINFAIPIDQVRELLPGLIENGRVVRPWHGVNGRIVPPALMIALGLKQGFMVETVEPGSPAEKLGLRGGTLPVRIGAAEYLLGGDIISRVNGESLVTMETVARIARSLRVGDRVELEYWQDNTLHTVEVVLPERPTLPADFRRFHDSPGAR